MSKLDLTQRTPRLVACEANDMFGVFEGKAITVGAKGLVDYVGFSIESLDSDIAMLKQAKAEIESLIKAKAGQQEIIKIEFAKFLNANGVEKLDGERISSIKVVQKAPTVKMVVQDEESLLERFGKVVLDESALKAALERNEEINGAHLSVTHNEDRVTIYKRKG